MLKAGILRNLMTNITATLQTFPIFFSCNENIWNNSLDCDLQQDCAQPSSEVTVQYIGISNPWHCKEENIQLISKHTWEPCSSCHEIRRQLSNGSPHPPTECLNPHLKASYWYFAPGFTSTTRTLAIIAQTPTSNREAAEPSPPVGCQGYYVNVPG